MPGKYIYLKDDLYEKLKEETNASALVSTLLKSHYEAEEEPPNLTPEEWKEVAEVDKVWKKSSKRLAELGIIDLNKPILVQK